jgi:hypothetical protein
MQIACKPETAPDRGLQRLHESFAKKIFQASGNACSGVKIHPCFTARRA